MYVVTGATGNTGSVVASNLLSRGEKVRVIGREAQRLQTLAAQGAEPFVADLADIDLLTKAFTGARAVYVMIPPDIKSPDVRAYQAKITESLASALESAGVTHAVVLSSYGADKPGGTGPVVGLHLLEERLNRLAGLHALHIRAGYFMENTLAQADIVKGLGFAAGPLRPDLKLPMIATRDIGNFAAEALSRLEFNGKQTQELLGQRDIAYAEVATIIGKAIGKPGLAYRHLPDEQIRGAMLQMGISGSMVDLLLEMSVALNSGHMRPLEERSDRNSTPTSYESFVADEFVPLYEGRSAAA